MGTVLEAARTVEGVREIVQILVDGNIDKGQAIRWITDALKDYDLGGPAGDSRWVMVSREKLQQVASVLDRKLGDTDPHFDDDMTDEDIRDEEPVFWACQQINGMLGTVAYPEPPPSAELESLRGFQEGFYRIADELDIPARPYSPSEALERDVLPRLRIADPAKVARLRELVASLAAKAHKPDAGACPSCDGSGGDRWHEADGSENGEKCPDCDGFGTAPVSEPAASGEGLPELPKSAARLHVQHFRECPSMRNADLHESEDFAPGSHSLFTAEQMRAYAIEARRLTTTGDTDLYRDASLDEVAQTLVAAHPMVAIVRALDKAAPGLGGLIPKPAVTTTGQADTEMVTLFPGLPALPRWLLNSAERIESYMRAHHHGDWTLSGIQSVRPAATTGQGDVERLAAEVERLNAIINTPQSGDFLRAVSIEAEHQRQRWSNDHDAGKSPADWFWLIGYLAGKALHAHAAGNAEKAEHHIITTAAACENWHRATFGETTMRPGIDGEAALAPFGQQQEGP